MAANAESHGNDAVGGAASRARDEYLAALRDYGLVADPFSEQDSHGLFFPGGERKQAVDSLLHFSRYATTPIFLTGAVGVGKTTVLNEFIRLKEADIEHVLVSAELMMTPERMLLAIAESFGVAIDDDALSAVYDGLIERWSQLARSDRHAVVAIDNVQDLSSEVLEALFELFVTADGNVKLVLVGESQAGKLIDVAANSVATLINRLDLQPFSQKDVADYLHYRMRAQGFEEELPFSNMQVQALTYRSRGNLVHLHQIASGMLQAAKRSGKASGRRFPMVHLIALTILSGVIVYLWRSGAPPPDQPHQQPIMLRGALDREEPGLPADSLSATRKTPAEVEAAMERVADSAEDAGELKVEPLEADQVGAAGAGDEVALVDSAQSAAAVLAASTLPVAEPAASLPPATVDPQSLPPQDEVSNQAAPDTANASVAINPQPEPAAQVPEPVDSVSPAHRRLLAWPDVGYALQIFGTHNPRRAKELVDEYFGQADLVFYETKHNGQPWYVVINGPYGGRDAARASIESLPEDLKRLRPWPRNVASIQADIRRYHAAISAESDAISR